jgi:hypothetical protein
VIDLFTPLRDHSTSDPASISGSTNAIPRKPSISADIADGWENIQRDIEPEDVEKEPCDEAGAEEKVAKPSTIEPSSQQLSSISSIPDVVRVVELPQVNIGSDPTLENAKQAPAGRSEQPLNTVTTNGTVEKNAHAPPKELEVGPEEKRLKNEVSLRYSIYLV